MIYEKSMMGLEEIAGNRRVLGMKHRQVLIMVDGKRTREELERNLSHLDVAQILADLQRLGYIEDVNARPAPSSAPPAATSSQTIAAPAQAAALSISQTQIVAVKKILVTSTNECLGIIGRGMSEKIEAVDEAEELMQWIGQWHMAIRESRLGKPLAGILMEQVQQTLGYAPTS